MDVRTLRYFVEVVRQQSFTRAAEKLFVTQPTISKMLRHFEDELECTLLVREGRKLHLTDSGQAVYQRGLAILAEWPILIYNEDFTLYKMLMAAFQQAGFEPKIAVRSGQWDFLAAMVQAGVGIATLPEPVCQWLDKENLIWLPLEPRMEWQVGLIWRQGSYLSHSAQAWIACCREYWPQP